MSRTSDSSRFEGKRYHQSFDADPQWRSMLQREAARLILREPVSNSPLHAWVRMIDKQILKIDMDKQWSWPKTGLAADKNPPTST